MNILAHLLPLALTNSMNRSSKGAVSPSEFPHHYHHGRKGSITFESFVGGLPLHGGHKGTLPFGASPRRLYTLPRKFRIRPTNDRQRNDKS